MCATIVQNVLCSPVRSNMARQLFLLQGLLLRPMREAITTPAPHQPAPPRLPRRKSTVLYVMLNEDNECFVPDSFFDNRTVLGQPSARGHIPASQSELDGGEPQGSPR